MNCRQLVAFGFVVTLVTGAGGRLAEAADDPPVALRVAAGRLLRVTLDEQVRIRRVGQRVTATVAENVYSFDRVVIPQGTKAHGYVANLQRVPTKLRVRAMLDGDFTPLRYATLQFDTLVLPDGTSIPVTTRVKASAENVSRQTAGSGKKSKAARVDEAVRAKIKDAAAPFTKPGRMLRLKYALIGRLPYHPQYLRAGTVHTVELLETIDFGTAESKPWAPNGTPARADAVLNARLITPLDSSKTVRENEVRAVLTEPVFSADERLILPEGTELQGTVTFARAARRFRRNGQLRFLFETVKLPAGRSEQLRASLQSTELSDAGRVQIDEEGGARITAPKSRFIAPAVSAVAAYMSLSRDPIDAGEFGNPQPINGANVGGRAFGGVFGFGVLGMVVGQMSRPVAASLGFIGLGQTVYATLLGKGQEMVFPADTPMQLQLSPASTSR